MSRKITDEKREAILRAAYEAFLTEGYAATSMSTIAAKVGGSKATIYNYFASKEELFAAVIDEKCQDFLAILFDPRFDMSDLRGALTRLGERFVRLLLGEDKIAVYRMVVAESARFPALGQLFYQNGPEHGKQQLAGLFARMIEEGKLRPADPAVMAAHFFDLAGGDLHRRKLWNAIASASDDEIRDQVAQGVDVFLAAYGRGAGHAR